MYKLKKMGETAVASPLLCVHILFYLRPIPESYHYILWVIDSHVVYHSRPQDSIKLCHRFLLAEDFDEPLHLLLSGKILPDFIAHRLVR